MEVVLLCAERQAATSIALAYADVPFAFVSYEPVVDGWDLPNVRFMAGGDPELVPLLQSQDREIIPLSGKWFSQSSCRSSARDLLATLSLLRAEFPQLVLNTQPAPAQLSAAQWIAKGDRWHRPDATLTGARDGETPEDPYGCGLVFQDYLPRAEHYIACGKRSDRGGVAFGVFRIYRESCARDDVLLAGETIRDEALEATLAAMLHHIDYKGYFTFNLLRRDGTFYISSFRPEPRAVFGTLLKAGVDCLRFVGGGKLVAAAGAKFIADIHYSGYTPLS